jgi:hypothetical protein
MHSLAVTTSLPGVPRLLPDAMDEHAALFHSGAHAVRIYASSCGLYLFCESRCGG